MAIDVISRLGGRVGYDYEPDGDEASRRQLERRAARRAGQKPPVYDDGPWAPRWLTNLLGDDWFASVAVVNLSTTLVTDEDLRCLRDLPRLRHLYLASVPRVTDDGLAVLASLRRLEHLDLGYNNLDSGGLSDACLVHLSGLRRLTSLSIANNRFTDAGFRHLEPLTNIEFLSVAGTNLTRDAIEQFRQSAPKCSVY